MIVTVANPKGGTGKTTTAAYLAHALAEAGVSVLAVDADPQGSLLEWSDLAEWSVPVIGLPVRNLHAKLPELAGRHQVVIVDTPPVHEAQGIVVSALRVCTHVVVPVAPAPVEMGRLAALRAMIEDVEPLREAPPVVRVLMVRTVAGTSSRREWRELLTADGWPVLAAEIPRWERITRSFGDPLRQVVSSPYGEAAMELLETVEVPA